MAYATGGGGIITGFDPHILPELAFPHCAPFSMARWTDNHLAPMLLRTCTHPDYWSASGQTAGELELTRSPRCPIVCDPDPCHAQFSCRVEFPTVAKSVVPLSPSIAALRLRGDMLTSADYTQDRQL